MSKKTAQLRAIGYAARARSEKRREAFIIAHEGTLEGFKCSSYKKMYWYILKNYGERIY